MSTATTSPDDVRRYSPSAAAMSDTELVGYIEDAEEKALELNALADFATGELDRLVQFYAAYLVERQSGEERTFRQGSRQVSISDGGDGAARGLLEQEIRANDPSGQMLATTDSPAVEIRR